MQGSANPSHPQRSPRSASQQWDRFEVALSKPSGRQKLGMVLKHAQIVGEDKVKRGAYLASLAEGPSVAQDLGLAPKDRLISIEGLDVKTLPFDRIVTRIRKASFPLTLVWSRQRKEGVSQNLPGTVVEFGAQRGQRAVENRPIGNLETKPPEAAPAPSPDAAAGGVDREPEPNETTNGEAEVVSSSTSPVDAKKEGLERPKDGKQRAEEQQQQQKPQRTLPGATPAAASAIRGGDKFGDNGGLFTEKGTCVIDRNKDSAGGNSGSSTSSNSMSGNGGGISSGMSLADVAEDWIRTTGKGRAASRAAREAESLGGEEREYGMRRASAGMVQGDDHVRHQRSRMEQQVQLQQKRQINIPTVGNIRQQQQQQQPVQYGSVLTQPQKPGLRQIQGLVQGTAAAPGAKLGGGAMTPLQSLYLGHSHRQQQRSGIRPVSEAAASAVAEVLSHQGIVPTTIARQKSPSWLQGNFGSQDGGGVVDGGGSGIKGASEKGSEEENLRASKERKVEAMKARRRERDKARREKIRREAAAGDIDRMLHDAISLRQQQQQQQQQPLSRPQGGTFGKGKRSISGRNIGALGAGSEDAVGAPDWLSPLMKAELRGFMGTRYCRSRLKQTLCHEWLQQEYRNGTALGQVDKDMPEIDFMRRRMAGGSLYALLEQESKDYLRPGAFTDADVELMGTNFAHTVCSVEGSVNPSSTRESEVSWADRLRSIQIDVPSTSYDLTASDDQEHFDALEGVAVGGVKLGGSETENGAWDGRGVEASVVIKHRKIFDARCCAYEALNSSSKNDKTSSLLDRTQRLYQDHANSIVAKRTTLEGTLENVRSQLRHREDQLHHLRSELSRVNPMDAAAVAALAENESVIVNRISEKELQMSMILEEVNKVIDWERTTELSRREAMQHAADVHGHGGASAAEAARERSELVQAMMSQKASLVVLSTFCKLRGPWLAPNGYVRRHSAVAISSDATSNTAATAAAASNSSCDDSTVRGAPEESISVSMKATSTNSKIRISVSSSADQGNGLRATQDSSISRVCDSSCRDVEEGDSVAGPERQPLNGRPQPSKPMSSVKKPEQKIKSIKLRLRPPSSKDDPGVKTRRSAIASGQGAKMTTAADEGGGRMNGVDDVGDSIASSKRRALSPEITASIPSSKSSSSPRALWGSSSCMAAVMARGGKEAAMARLGSERRAVEAAKASTEASVAQDGDDCGVLETTPSERKLAEGGGGSSDSVSEGGEIDGGGSGDGEIDGGGSGDGDNPMGNGDSATSMEEGNPMEDGIGPLSFESVGSSSPCSSKRMEAFCFGEDDDAGGKNDRDGDNQFGDSSEM